MKVANSCLLSFNPTRKEAVGFRTVTSPKVTRQPSPSPPYSENRILETNVINQTKYQGYDFEPKHEVPKGRVRVRIRRRAIPVKPKALGTKVGDEEVEILSDGGNFEIREPDSTVLSTVVCPEEFFATTITMTMPDDKGTDLSQKAYFTVGSQIKCRYQGRDVEGQVSAFNHANRILVIRSTSSCGSSNKCNLSFINADCIDKLSVEDPTPTENLKPIDFQKLEKRRQKMSSNKKSRIRALSAEVPAEARKLFLTIIKTIDEVTWDGDKIMVLNEVRISPPYTAEDVQGEKEASVVHVKKIVDKHWKEISSHAVNK